MAGKEEKFILAWSGQLIEVVKKKIKHGYVRVTAPEGKIKLSVPRKYTRADVERLLEDRRDWLLKHQRLMQQREILQPKKKLAYVSGETVLVWGEKCELVVQEAPDEYGMVKKEAGRLILVVPSYAGYEERRKLVHGWYRRELQRMIEPLRRRCEPLVGKKAKEWRIRDMHTRWGTCNVGAKRIWLSLHLAKQPLEALEYVAIHELTHLWEANHGEGFKARLALYCPQWRQVKKRLDAAADFN